MTETKQQDLFDRPVYCIAGLPFDAVSLEEAARIVGDSARTRKKLFFSTPNVNFLVASLSSRGFRDSVIASDLSVADGMPLIWIARLLGLPFRERVAGSNLFNCLDETPAEPPLGVFFFGGMEGVAERACKVLNGRRGGLECRGAHDPGFSDVESMSVPAVLDHINGSGADFVVVALGARKGQEWIMHNRDKLEAPVISHLGAVINFVAGNIRQAPGWMQKSGLEWLWRVREEPGLWRRYFHDGAGLLKLLCFRILPYALWLRLNGGNHGQGHIRTASDGPELTLFFEGDFHQENLEVVRQAFRSATAEASGGLAILDLSGATSVDPAFLGLVLLFVKAVTEAGGKVELGGLSPGILRILRWNCLEYLLDP